MTAWSDDAACRGCEPELWYANDRHRADSALALTICRECPITAACLKAAMVEEDVPGNCRRHGIRGGLTALQRGRLAGRQVAA